MGSVDQGIKSMDLSSEPPLDPYLFRSSDKAFEASIALKSHHYRETRKRVEPAPASSSRYPPPFPVFLATPYDNGVLVRSSYSTVSFLLRRLKAAKTAKPSACR